MNPLTQIRQIKKINETELKLGIAGEGKSWHDVYKDSAWVFVGGLSFDLTEGDVITIFSQYGEVVNMNLVRDPKTGKSRGFAFICYEDQRSTVLAVDNLNGIKVTGRTIRVDHVANYRPPTEKDETDELTRLIYERGCGPDIDLQRLEKEAAKREAAKADAKGGMKRDFDKPWPKGEVIGSDRRRRYPHISDVKMEYDDDGDVRRARPAKVKLEYDDDGDVRRAPVARAKVDIDDDGDVSRRRVKAEIDDDGDIRRPAKVAREYEGSKRPSLDSSSRHYDKSSAKYRSDDRSSSSKHSHHRRC